MLQRYEDLDNDAKSHIDDLVDWIGSSKVIPVIGYELHKEIAGGNFLKWLMELRLRKISGDNNLDIDRKYPGVKSGMEYVNNCYKDFNNEFKFSSFGNALKPIINNAKRTPVYITSPIEQLIRIKNFNFYVNTTILDSMEIAFRLFRENPQQLTVVGPNKVDWASSFSNADSIQRVDIEYPVTAFEHNPVIFNFFGRYSDRTVNISEIHLAEVLYDYIKYEQDYLGKLGDALKPAAFLFIGCNFPDWIYRFIVRVLYGERVEDVNLKRIIVAAQGFDGKIVFISQTGILSFNLPPCDFVNIIYNRLSSDHKSELFSKKAFISFSSDDRVLARSLKDQLEKGYGIKCFFDENYLTRGEVITDLIRHEIDDCSVFIPVVSKNVQAAVAQTRYVLKEWDYACINNIKIYPVYTADYDPRLLLNTFENMPQVRDKIINKDLLGLVMGREQLGENEQISETFCHDVKEAQMNARSNANNR